MRGASESEMVPANMTAEAAANFAAERRLRSFLVMDDKGIAGAISEAQLLRFAAEKPQRKLSEFLKSDTFPHVHPDHGLEAALERMGAAELDILPIVSRFNIHELVGVVYLSDILKAYRISA